RISCLKCFTALVTKTSLRGIPASRQRTVEHPPRRSDKRLTREVFLVARLLADQHDVRGPAPLARYRLRRVLVEGAARAFVLRFGKVRQRVDCRRKLEIELRLVSHRALLGRPRPINPRPPPAVRRGVLLGGLKP